MNRVLKIVIYAVVLFLVYLWISSVAKSCNNRSSADSDFSSQESNPEITTDDEIYDEYFESEEKDDTENSGLQPIRVDESVDEEEDRTSAASVPEVEDDFSFEEPAKKEKPAKPTNNYSSSNTSGNFMVIAGSYLIKDNATKMVNRLKNLGYNSAEIVNFDLSQYHSISAGKYNSYEDASKAARAIKNKGIDCYVHSRK